MKILLAFLIVFTASRVCYAQCDVKVYTAQNAPVYQTQFEEFFKNVGENNNGDYGYGFQKVYACVAATGKSKSQWSLFIGVSTHGAYSSVVPRQIEFTFSNGRNFEKTAASHNLKDGVDIYEFILSSDESSSLTSGVDDLKESIERFTVRDNRTGAYISGRPIYSQLIAEQIQCIKSK